MAGIFVAFAFMEKFVLCSLVELVAKVYAATRHSALPSKAMWKMPNGITTKDPSEKT